MQSKCTSRQVQLIGSRSAGLNILPDLLFTPGTLHLLLWSVIIRMRYIQGINLDLACWAEVGHLQQSWLIQGQENYLTVALRRCHHTTGFSLFSRKEFSTVSAQSKGSGVFFFIFCLPWKSSSSFEMGCLSGFRIRPQLALCPGKESKVVRQVKTGSGEKRKVFKENSEP